MFFPLAPFGGPWSPFGRLRTPAEPLWGVFWNLLKIGHHFPSIKADIRYHRACILPAHPRIAAEAPEAPGVAAEPLLGPRHHKRWGQDDVS